MVSYVVRSGHLWGLFENRYADFADLVGHVACESRRSAASVLQVALDRLLTGRFGFSVVPCWTWVVSAGPKLICILLIIWLRPALDYSGNWAAARGDSDSTKFAAVRRELCLPMV